MTTIDLYNRQGETVDQVELSDAIFGCKVNEPLMHQAVVTYLAARRAGTHAVKTRAMVSGGGKKPWRQKGTGRARVGSSRNPVWRGGGVAFGPQVRSHAVAMPKKMRRLALLSALSLKNLENKIVIVDELEFSAPKTKEMAQTLNNLSANNALIVLGQEGDNTLLSARNLPKVGVLSYNGLNTYSVLRHDKLVITKEALELLEGVLANA